MAEALRYPPLAPPIKGKERFSAWKSFTGESPVSSDSERSTRAAKQKDLYRIEICENGAVAFLGAEDDFFAAGKIIKEAEKNPIKSLEDKLSFTAPRDRHQVQGSIERCR